MIGWKFSEVPCQKFQGICIVISQTAMERTTDGGEETNNGKKKK